MKAGSGPAIHSVVVQEPLDAGAMFRAHGAFVARFLAWLGARGQELEDLVQEVFLVAHRRGGFQPGAARPTTWLAEIALRVWKTARRTRRRRPEQTDLGALALAPAPGSSPAESAELAQAAQRIARALASLDADTRALLVLFEIEGEPCDAIAASLGIPVGTVYSRLHAARRKLGQAYDGIVGRSGHGALRAREVHG